ncbi:MAG: YidC/Oxa1 family membrane protein insertase [Eubacteriales bacterium]|nr:YidC/Oxa1 family membrane protein insertase [Eubacteriales bacterium]
MEFLSNNFISEFFVIVLKWVYSIVQSYPAAIIIVTIAIRLLILPLDLRQKQSSRKMAMVQPKLESLKKRYANNPQQLQKKQKELYKNEGVKPLAGCLPMLITLPIFFAFFGAMRVLAAEQTITFLLNAQNIGGTAYELPRWLWVNNFWQPDSGFSAILPSAGDFVSFVQSNVTYINPQSLHMLSNAGLISYNASAGLQGTAAYDTLVNNIIVQNGLEGVNNGWFVLPILAGGTLFLQQKISMGSNPQMQQQGKFMLWFFPLFSIYICATTNAAFAVYWLFANIYALAQLLVLNYIYKKRDQKTKPDMIEEAS